MDTLQSITTARELLSQVTPLKGDCGRQCGAACCYPDEDGHGGMLLFPMEEKLYTSLPAGFSLRRDDSVIENGWLLLCEGECRREDRPLSCRLFPLLPTETGTRLDRRGWAVCPLMTFGKRGLSKDFVEAVAQAGRILYACPEHARFLSALHAFCDRLASFE